MARLARGSWGLEANVLRTAYGALLTSLSGFALVTIGSGAYERGLRSLATQHANVSARRITDISRSARLAALHMSADVRSAHNLSIRQCALKLDRTLRVADCMFQARIRGIQEAQYGAAQRGARWVRPDLSLQERGRAGGEGDSG